MRIHAKPHPLAVCLLLALSGALRAEPDHQPRPSDETAHSARKQLGTVTVTGLQPTSLPTQIPTTIEGIRGDEVERKINAIDSPDALKYFPSLLVRKRYIGDFDHAVLATRASGTGNSARSLIYADGILLSNLLGNGASFTPRWGLVTPEEIERVDVLYGPFSAAYPGNSVGAVVDYVTRMPQQFEAHAKFGYYTQKHDLYATKDWFPSWQASTSIGSRSGDFSWWINLSRLDSQGHPIAFATRLLSAGTSGSGTPVSGAVAGNNPRNQPWWLLGATNQIDTVQDHAKIKLAYDFTPTLRLSYVYGWWDNDAVRDSSSFLRDASGNPVYSGNVLIDGRRYALTAADISLQRQTLEHQIHGLSLKSNSGETFDYTLSASRYDYTTDLTRSPTLARPQADTGGAGRIADGDGTGWTTFNASGTWRSDGIDGAHVVDFGLQHDTYDLRTVVYNTSDWLRGGRESRFSAFEGQTRLTSLYVQDTWRFAPAWVGTLGLRHERWRAQDGALSNTSQTLRLPTREESDWSPKAALAWQFSDDWSLQASLGRALRNPTVSELYQGTISTNVIVNNDPNLKPERSWTSELSALRRLDPGTLRTTVFYELTDDALYSQTNVTVTPNVTNIQNVDRIRTRGLELAWQTDSAFIEGLSLSSSLTYAQSIITQNANFPASEGQWQPRVPRWRANLLASYRLNDHWNFSLGARYSGKQFNTLDNADPNGSAYTGVGKFLVADARARWQINEHWSAAFGIDNLGDRTYWAFHPYNQRTYALELRYDAY